MKTLLTFTRHLFFEFLPFINAILMATALINTLILAYLIWQIMS